MSKVTEISGAHSVIELPAEMLPTDALFWYAEKAAPGLRPIVGGMLVLDRSPDRDGFRRSVRRMVTVIPRLQQKVVQPAGSGLPRWVDDVELDLDYHVREVQLPAPAGEDEVLRYVARVFSAPLDPLRPLWEAHLITGLENFSAVLFFKLHHAVVDGVGSLTLFEALTQQARDEVIVVPQPRGAGRRRKSSAANGSSYIRLAGGTLATGVQLLLQPAQWGRTARSLRGLLGDLAAPVVDDPLTVSQTSVGRRLSAVTLPMARLRRLKDSLGVTLNDVVLTALAGALARCHRARPGVDQLRCMVPMSLRNGGGEDALGNRIGMWNIALPVNGSDPLARLDAIRAQTGAAKRDGRGALYPALLQALPFLPEAAFRYLAQYGVGRVNLMCTNVPGPAEQRFLGGARVNVIYPFAPLMLGAPLSVALLSYAGTYCIGVSSNPAAMSDRDDIAVHFTNAIEELEKCAGRASRGTKILRPARAAVDRSDETPAGVAAANENGTARRFAPPRRRVQIASSAPA